MSLNQASQTPSSLSSFPDAQAILMNAPMGIFTSTLEGCQTLNGAMIRDGYAWV